MPLGLLALLAVGIHAAADLLDDHLLTVLRALDAWVDGGLARFEFTADWVNRIDARECTFAARALALGWELAVDGFIGLPALGYFEATEVERTWSLEHETWRGLFSRLNQQPTPMRVFRPVFTAVFAVGGAYTVMRLVESTLFVGLVGDVAPANVAAAIARVSSIVAVVLMLASLGWRAVLRALQHADARSEAATTSRARFLVGSWGTLLAAPLAAALTLEARALLSVVL